MDRFTPDALDSHSLMNVQAAATPAPIAVVDDSIVQLPLDHLPLGGIPLRHIEKVAIRQTLRRTGGNKVTAARELGIAVSTLYEKLKRHATE
jgi:DNA-binding NtrC family response regulator